MALLGIDLGTTNSLGALFLDDEVRLVPNAFGEYLTPSVVSFDDDGKVIVGAIARERLITHPDVTFSSFKRNMGTDKTYTYRNKKITSSELSSFVIQSIVRDAQLYIKDRSDISIDEVVISVPAYFRDKQRVATQEAGALAGVKVHRIINEPSAAALAVFSKRKQEEMILVFDFGGGTLDISIVDCFENVVEIISVAGDNRLGGDDFNKAIADYFIKTNKIPFAELTTEEYAILIKNSEICKKQITAEGMGYVSMLYRGETISTAVTNEILMEEAGWIFGRIKILLEKALKDAELTINEIGSVVMAGGSSNMPIVQSFIRVLFQDVPVYHGGGDELIARGVGLVCGIIERSDTIKDVIMTDICPFSLGTSIHNEGNPGRPYMSVIIPRNNTLPCTRSNSYTTVHDFQTYINLDILQGESIYADENTHLGEMVISIPPRPKGDISVIVRFTYDINGVLIIDVTLSSTGRTKTKILSQTLQGSVLEKKIEELKKFKIKEQDDDELIMARINSIYKDATRQVQDQIQRLVMQYEVIKNTGEMRSIRRYRSIIVSLLDQYEKNNKAYDVFRKYEDENDGDNE